MVFTRSQLLACAQTFCKGVADKQPLDDLMSQFSSTHLITAHEHGLPFLAPFLGRTFTGRTGPNSVEEYFKLLQKYLTYENMSFSEWIVDADAQRVSAKGVARFKWTEGGADGNEWNERFAYMLDFDDEGKVTDYQVWADSGAAYLASKGQLDQSRKEFETKEGQT